MYKLFYSKPSDGNSFQNEIATYDTLDKIGISYIGTDHDEAPTIEALKEVESILNVRICKNLFLCNSQKSRFYLLIMPGDKKFLTKKLSKQINSARLSFADGSYMEDLLKTSPGSLSIFSLIFDKEHKVKLIIDKEVLKDDYLGFHPCQNTRTLKVKSSDLLEKFLPYTGHEPQVLEL